MKLFFEKMHGLGNDFIVIEDDGHTDYCALASKLCKAHTGVGADGILVVEASDKADVKMRIINSDGSEAEMCGNGIRCFSKYVYEHGIVRKEMFTVDTLSGIMKPKLIINENVVEAVEVDMGRPDFACSALPMLHEGEFVEQKISACGREFVATAVLMGVPHLVVFQDTDEPIEVERIGCELENNTLFPKKTNVDFVKVYDRNNISVRTWERGCGATYACGTGSCASVCACMKTGRTDNGTICVHLALGELKIRRQGEGNVVMTGAAETVYTANIDIDI